MTWKNWESGRYKLYTTAETRLDHSISRLYYYRIGENFAFKAHPNLTLEAHYSCIIHKPFNQTQFQKVGRLELEVDPSYTLDNGISFIWRNRLDLLKKQGIYHIQFVGRHRTMAIFPVNYGCLASIRMHDELFYDFDTNRITQNRFVPLELSWEFNRGLYLHLFVMLRNFYSFSEQRWHKSFVFGTEWGF